MIINLLNSLIFIPLITALAVFITPAKIDNKGEKVKIISLVGGLITFVLSIVVWIKFNKNTSDFQFEYILPIIKSANINYYLGIDGISLFLILLTTFLTPICILASLESIKFRIKEFLICFLVLESLIIGVFCARDLVLFYIFFEFMLIPMFFIIGIWGGTNRIYAAFKFFLYTLAGSLFLLLAIIYIYLTADNLVISNLYGVTSKFPLEVQKWLWLAFFVSFAVKVPMWPVHTWLPDAHVQAPTAGSVILAGILLKMGGYGFIRFSLPMFPEASIYFSKFIFILSIIAVIYASLVALAQTDMKKLIAYSSIAHMGFVTVGIFTFNLQGIEGAMVQMISHGLVSAALFLCVGVLYDRMHTKEIAAYGGVTAKMPLFAAIFLFFTMASIGLPGTSGFVGEFMTFIGVFKVDKIVTAFIATGVILGACYMLWLYGRVMFGEIKNKEVLELKDLTMREIIIFIPMIILVLIIGIYPSVITDLIHLPIYDIIKLVTLKNIE